MVAQTQLDVPRNRRTQFSLLLTVVVGSAVIPTIIAQRWFTRRHARPAAPELPRQGAAAEPGAAR